MGQCNNIVYQQLSAADYVEYRRVRLESLRQYPDCFGSTYEEEFHLNSLKLDRSIKEADDYNFAMGAFTQDKKLIGLCGLITDMRVKTRHRSEIIHVFVDRQYGNQGVGKKLLQLTIDKAFHTEETKMIMLGVVHTNNNAVKLYKQLDFTEYGKLEKYFKSGDKYFTQLFLQLSKETYFSN